MSIHSIRAAHPRAAAAALGAGLLALVVGLGSPASAAVPAVQAQAEVQSAFDVDTAVCTLTGSNPAATQTVTVPTSGTKSFARQASGTASAVNTGDPSDSVTMKATNKVTGSVTGAGGAFSKLSATIDQSASITEEQGLLSQCDPGVMVVGGVMAVAHVKRAGKITATLTIPQYALGQLVIQDASGAGVVVVSFLRKGTHTISRPVQPGDYQIITLVQSQARFDPPYVQLDVGGTAKVAVTYSTS